MPFTFKNSQKAVAVFFLIGIFLLLAIMILIGKGSDILTMKDSYYTIYDEGYGMGSGAAIKYKGISIGKIKKLALTEDEKVRIDFWIFDDYRKLIRKDSVLKAQSSLLGSASLILLPSIDPATEVLPKGSKVISSDMDEGRIIMVKLDEMNPNKSDLTATAKKVLDQVVDMMPIINSTLLNVRDSTGSVKTILAGLKGSDTSVVSDKLLATLDNVKSITKNFKDLSEAINSTNNTIGALVKDNKAMYAKVNSMLDSVDASMKNVRNLSDKLKDSPEEIQQLTALLKDNLIELRKVLTGVKNLLGGEKVTDKNIKTGDRN